MKKQVLIFLVLIFRKIETFEMESIPWQNQITFYVNENTKVYLYTSQLSQVANQILSVNPQCSLSLLPYKLQMPLGWGWGVLGVGRGS